MQAREVRAQRQPCSAARRLCLRIALSDLWSGGGAGGGHGGGPAGAGPAAAGRGRTGKGLAGVEWAAVTGDTGTGTREIQETAP